MKNPLRGSGLSAQENLAVGDLARDPAPVLALLSLCPVAKPTPLVSVPSIARKLGISALYVKDERERMGLGSFKALGAAYAIAKRASHAAGGDLAHVQAIGSVLKDRVFITSSAGNHGMSVAAGARIFGARAVIYLSKTVPESFADRLRRLGAEVVVHGDDYEESMAGAIAAAAKNNWDLLSDSTWPDNTEPGRDIMEGYLAMAVEAVSQLTEIGARPTHTFLQAGVGGLAGAATVLLRDSFGDDLNICVVEPEAAPAIKASVEAGEPVRTAGPVSNMGRLDCKEPSHLALKCLAREADEFMTLSDEYVARVIAQLGAVGLSTSPSGGAGFAGLVAAVETGESGLNLNSEVVLFLSEGPSDD